jgi:hypothetical protein
VVEAIKRNIRAVIRRGRGYRDVASLVLKTRKSTAEFWSRAVIIPFRPEVACVSSYRLLSGSAILVVALSASHSGSAGKPVRRAKQRICIMGFDGMDPTLARKFMDEGKLPNLKKLAESATFAKLESTQPSESPVAWSSFATGANPGKHNIYDSLVRDFKTYMPDLARVKKEPPQFLWGTFPTKRPKAILDARRYVVLGPRRARWRQQRRAHGTDDVPARGDRARRDARGPAPA